MPQLQIPRIRLARQSDLAHPLFHQIGVVDALAAAGDLAVAFRGQQVHAAAGLRTPLHRLHVERLDRAGIVIDEDRPVEHLRYGGFVRAAEVLPPFDLELFRLFRVVCLGGPFLQPFHSLVVTDAVERRGDRFQPLDVAFEDVQFGAMFVQHALDDIGDELLFHRHHVFQRVKRHLRLHHPELGQVAARLRFLGAEGRPEAVHLAEGGDVGLVVKLARLRQIGRLAEVIHLKQGGGLLACRRRDDGRIHQQVAVVVQPLAHGPDDRRPNPQDRPLACGAHPQMAVVHQELRAVLFGPDGVVAGDLDDVDTVDTDFIAAGDAGRAFVCPHRPRDDDRRFLCQ